MVVVFVVCLCCVLHLVWLSSLVVCKKVLENILRGLILPYYKVNRCYFVAHPDLHHTGCKNDGNNAIGGSDNCVQRSKQ